jgi:hypothetical protein
LSRRTCNKKPTRFIDRSAIGSGVNARTIAARAQAVFLDGGVMNLVSGFKNE